MLLSTSHKILYRNFNNENQLSLLQLLNPATSNAYSAALFNKVMFNYPAAAGDNLFAQDDSLNVQPGVPGNILLKFFP